MGPPFIAEGTRNGPLPRWNANEVGKKAVGLSGLPPAWCPPFVVVTTSAHQHSLSRPGTDNARWLFEEAGLRESIDRVFGAVPPTTRVLVRSSAPQEGLDDRGRFESAACDNRDTEIAATIARLWAESGESPAGMALIIQRQVTGVLKGHLSNERRLSSDPQDWLCEYEGSRRRARTRRVAAGDAAAAGGTLACTDRAALFRQLAAVAACGTRVWDRVHYEWVWDGRGLWVVQQDVEEPKAGKPPGASGPRPVQQATLDMAVLIPSEHAIGPWNKVHNARVFRNCGLKTVPIYAIEGDAPIRGLAGGRVDPRLAEDVGKLGALPIVVRTDVGRGVDYPPTLLARTDCVDAPAALRFVAEQSAALVAAGLAPSQFCFLLHNYLTADSSSLSRATPSSNSVTIDATWGNADGLMYYPHDSFDVALGRRVTVRQRVRCKSQFIDCGDDGRWQEREAGVPWDWVPSLRKSDAIAIAQATKRIADRVGHAVEVMHFIGVEAGESSPVCLPWYFNSESKDEADPSEGLQAVSIFSKRIITIRTTEDLDREVGRAAARKPSPGCTLRLVPSQELMRKQSFLEAVSRFAVQYRLPVRLVGSTLSHVFYVLRRQGVKLKVPLPHRKRQRSRLFNKLVRDNIPRIIRGRGEAAHAVRVRLADHPDLIKAKLIEEAFELFWEQEPKGLRRELSDVVEVVQAICNLIALDFEEVMAEAGRRKQERGGFDTGTILLETGPQVCTPRSQQLTLFDANDDRVAQGDLADLRTRRPESDRPRGTKTGLSIPAIPPDSDHQQRPYPIRSGDGRLDVLVTYSGRNIIVRPSPTGNREDERTAARKVEGLAGLFGGEEPES